MTKPGAVADGDGGQGQIRLLSAGPVGSPTSGSDGNAIALADHQSGRCSSLQLPGDRRGSSDSHHAMPTGQAGRDDIELPIWCGATVLRGWLFSPIPDGVANVSYKPGEINALCLVPGFSGWWSVSFSNGR
jgi:hypothetical protein